MQLCSKVWGPSLTVGKCRCYYCDLFVTSTVLLHRFVVFMLLRSASPPLLQLKLPVPPVADSLTGTCSVSLFKALLSGQGNLSDSEKHSRKTLTPADQGDALFNTA